MRTIIFILRKEFLQIFRNRTMIPLIFVLPVFQLVILVHAATMEMRNIKMSVVDNDLSETSHKLISKFSNSPFFEINYADINIEHAEDLIKNNKCDVILHIPEGFERDLIRENKAHVQFRINAINSTVAGLINAYSNNIILMFNQEMVSDFYKTPARVQTGISVSNRYWFNPELKFKIYMLPGILVILVTIIGAFLTALNIIREKETGTIEQINVTPIKKYQFILGKLIPFWIIAMFELSIGLLVGYVFFDLPVNGSLFTLFLFTSVYLILAMGIGLFLAAISQTQQQVMFMIFFFLLVFIMMAGIFTPVGSMPEWAQKVNIINPFAYFIKANRMILLKGSSFSDVFNEFISLAVYGMIMFSLAIWRYRKTT
ncbi:MAG: ABC transporter permease [Bacteroidota bacterium]